MTGPQVIPTPDGPGADKWMVPGYTPSRELGSGASGRVVLARHDETGSPVAIKYLSERLCGDATFLAGFRAEARLLDTLRSPYVVEFYEYVETLLGAAIVMEPVDGIALRALLKQEGATEPEAALTVLKGSLLGLAAAHAAGVVHRDYKPDNVLIAADGTSKLVDFGIAVASGEAGNPAGTPVYMAPEQWTGQPASPATDVYAATATFFECLTGAKPYAGETAMELAMQHMEAPIPDALAPEPVRPLIRSGLAKTPGERPASAADFVAELEAVATAAYGEDWEERGQRKLAALAALLLLLFPLADPGASGTTALATTALGSGRAMRGRLPLNRRGKALAGVAAGALLLGGITVTAVAVGNHPATARRRRALRRRIRRRRVFRPTALRPQQLRAPSRRRQAARQCVRFGGGGDGPAFRRGRGTAGHGHHRWFVERGRRHVGLQLHRGWHLGRVDRRGVGRGHEHLRRHQQRQHLRRGYHRAVHRPGTGARCRLRDDRRERAAGLRVRDGGFRDRTDRRGRRWHAQPELVHQLLRHGGRDRGRHRPGPSSRGADTDLR